MIRNMWELGSDLCYIEVRSKPAPPERKHKSSLGQGLMIFSGFLLSILAIVIAI